MDRLYLIRRKLETFVGPMTMLQLKESFQRMEFGLQDEIAGHCGRWVTLENRKALQGTYPEIFTVFHPGIMDPWVETGATKKIATSSKKIKKKPVEPVPSEAKSSKLAVVFLLFGFVAGGIAVFLTQAPSINMISISSLFSTLISTGPKIEEIHLFFTQGDLPGYTAYIEKHKEKILKDVALNKTKESLWMPYLRFYAFQARGEVQGLTSKQLRGAGAYTAPADCGVDVWKKNWIASKDQWADLIHGKKLGKANWGRLLAWDPHWIKRRRVAGWIEPPNYHGACIYMAYLAFEEVIGENGFMTAYKASEESADEVVASIRGRLGWLSYVVNRTPTFNGTLSGRNQEGFLSPSYWTCLEASASFVELDSCKRGYTPTLPLWISFEDDRLAQNLIRLTIKDKKKVPTEIMEKLEAIRPNISPTDHFTRFDVRTELNYLDQLIKNKGDVIKSMPKVSPENDSVDFTADFSN
jgi:hypothetical protein